VMRRCGRDNVWLDARHLGEPFLRARFPQIWAGCADAGYDLAHDLIPVAPAAHYQCGGVLVDIDGRTSVPGLYASGEVACTGLHGANRLASNSLLEGLVFSRRIARALASGQAGASTSGTRTRGVSVGGADEHAPREAPCADAPASPAGTRVSAADDAGGLGSDGVLERLHAVTRAGLGMSRDGAGLVDAVARLDALDAGSCSAVLSPSVADLEAANLITVAALIARGALAREESRGCHYRSDHPQRDDAGARGRFVWNRSGRSRFVPVEPA